MNAAVMIIGIILIVGGLYFIFVNISPLVTFIQDATGILIPEDARTYADILAKAIFVFGVLFLVGGAIY